MRHLSFTLSPLTLARLVLPLPENAHNALVCNALCAPRVCVCPVVRARDVCHTDWLTESTSSDPVRRPVTVCLVSAPEPVVRSVRVRVTPAVRVQDWSD